MEADISSKWCPRSNCDQACVDDHSERFIPLCKASGAQIVNGRNLGDLLGAYTCFSHSDAPSTIDYMLRIDPELVRYMVVEKPGEFSIHCLLLRIFTGDGFFRSSPQRPSPSEEILFGSRRDVKYASAFVSADVRQRFGSVFRVVMVWMM